MPSFPSGQKPQGRGLPLPFTPPRGPRSEVSRIGGTSFGAPEPFQERTKNPSIFQSNFQPILVAFWVPKCLPKLPKSQKNQSKNASGKKNVIFLKIATRSNEKLKMEGPGLPKPSQNQPKTLQKPIQNLTKNLINFCIDFFSILASIW